MSLCLMLIMDGTNNAWYLIQCKPREAFRAEQHLANQGFHCFLPVHSVRRRRGGEFRWVTEPLFPHYLFIHLGPDSNWSVIRSTRGVARIVEFHGQPARVPAPVVDGLRRHLELAGERSHTPLYQAGDRVIITRGSLHDLEAMVKATRGEDRVILLLNILNREQEIELPQDCLAPV